jgi:hypothetical protein
LPWDQLRRQLAAKTGGGPCSFTPFAFSLFIETMGAG